MAKNNEFLGLNGFIWFFGVVESRYDPLEIGRCKVRCMGWHTEDKDVLPIDDLPWAIPMQDIKSAALSGIGSSPTGLIEGSWVVGFFMDGPNAQYPIILGSIAGIPGGAVMGNAFRDPRGIYPYANNVPDVPALSRGEIVASEDQTLKGKRDSRLTEIPTAVASRVDTVFDTSSKQEDLFERQTYDELKPRYGNNEEANASTYPFNHVNKTESGHVFEVDDTPGSERLHRYHKAGTFEEVQADGSRVVKVVGNNYELYSNGSNVFINGVVNITIQGDAHILTKGNRIEEVDGDHHITVHGDRITKIGGNDVKEVVSDSAVQINGGSATRISKDSRFTFGENLDTKIGKNYSLSVSKNLRETVSVNHSNYTFGNTSIVSFGSYDVGAVKNLNLAAATKINMKSVDTTEMTASVLNIANDTNITGTLTATTDAIGGGISLLNHTHAQTADSGGDTQEETEAPS